MNEAPAIRIDSQMAIKYAYEVDNEINGYYSIYRKVYQNNVLELSELKAYVDYPSYHAYNVTIQGQDPDFNTYIPLDQLLMGFIQEETGYNLSFDVNAFLTGLFSALQTIATDSNIGTPIQDESTQFFAQLQQPINATFWQTYQITERHDASYNYNLYLEKDGNYQQQVCDQWWNDGGQLYCVKYGYRTSTYTIETLGQLALASQAGFPLTEDTVLLLKTPDMITNPSTPYFFTWLMNTEQTVLGTQFNQSLQNQIEAQDVNSPVTNTNVSLVLDPNAPAGVNPYVADVTVTDTKGNMALGTLPLTVKASNGTILGTGTVVNGTGSITLPDYEQSATAIVGGNSFYLGSQAQSTVQYNLQSMIQTQGPAGSDTVANAKFTIIRDYVQKSGAFTYNAATDNYTWNGNDNWNGLSGCYKGPDNE